MFNIPQMYILFCFRFAEAKKEVMLRNRPAHDTLGSFVLHGVEDGKSDVNWIENQLNNRPRKTLGYLSPIQFALKHQIALQI
jgi:hypothetical protein